MTFDSDRGCNEREAPSEHSITAGGLRWHYLRWGQTGPVCVLWHGVTSNARGWWRLGPQLAGLGLQVFAPDLPGHGGTDDAPDGYAVDGTARLLDAWLAAVNIADPLILGHSWGGLNALWHARLPDARVRARALILEDPALQLARDPRDRLPYFLANVGVQPDAAVRDQLAAANPRWHACDVYWKAEARAAVRQAAVEGFFWHNAGLDAAAELQHLAVPTLLLLADARFGGIWAEQHVALVRNLGAPHLIVELIPGSSHNIHRDSFEPFAQSVANFVREPGDSAA